MQNAHAGGRARDVPLLQSEGGNEEWAATSSMHELAWKPTVGAYRRIEQVLNGYRNHQRSRVVWSSRCEAAEWFDRASISDIDRFKIGRLNALKLFKIGSG